MFNNIKNRGFTLLEVLLVVAIIAILAGIVIVAINPNKQLADTRDAQRKSDVNTILNAVYQYAIDNNGTIPSTITTTETEICDTAAASCTSLIDLAVLTTDEKYLVSMPVGPQASTTNGTGYSIKKSSNGRITVTSLGAENSSIQVTR